METVCISPRPDEKEIESKDQDSFTKDMIDNFFKQARSSYAEGLGSFYTYERQVPEVADVKISGLKLHYGVNTKEGLQFFEVHKDADVIHRAECEKLLDDLSPEDQKSRASSHYCKVYVEFFIRCSFKT